MLCLLVIVTWLQAVWYSIDCIAVWAGSCVLAVAVCQLSLHCSVYCVYLPLYQNSSIIRTTWTIFTNWYQQHLKCFYLCSRKPRSYSGVVGSEHIMCRGQITENKHHNHIM